MLNYITKTTNFLSFIKRNFVWIFALIFGVINVIKPFIAQKKKTDEMNSMSENRKEAIGVADKNGFKQVQTTASNSPKPNEIPVGVIPETKTTISGEGTIKPVSETHDAGERTTEEVMNDLKKALNRN